ncbi:MAG: uridine kinase family protein [Oscillospiraceae bacterium]|jgi:uridine kinase
MDALIERVRALLAEKTDPVIVGIDGDCCSGKTTLAARLSQVLDCNIFHADDFFLRPAQRTEARLKEPGGNLDRERLLAQILEPLRAGKAVTFQPFSCATMSLLPSVTMPKKCLNVVEGAYSLHPDLWNMYDLRVFLTAPREIRLERLRRRESDKIDTFLNLWIPLEDEYFRVFDIESRVDIVLSGI